ncbi:MAG: hypothetical protein H0X03_08745 [Nitrosopumilus sp.]|nr:hypothetical protein [Nitrosopumilus sp.]
MNEIEKQTSEITIEKRNGNIEIFDKEKLTRGISRAGIPFLLSKDIATSIYNILNEKSLQDSITSVEIKNLVVEELKSRNQSTIAESYSGYSKNKVTSTKEEQFRNDKNESKVASSMNTQAKQNVKDKDNTSGKGT